jgi:hypothetical integral membrane protein (TIGR02206 family)
VDGWQLWTADYDGERFELFSPSHLVTLVALTLLVASFLLLRGPRRAPARAAFRYTAAGLLIGIELLLQLWAASNGVWTVREYLPLQLCSVSQYLSVAMLLTRSRRLYEYVYYFALGGAVPALLTPSLGYGCPHFRFWEYAISHVLVVSAPLYMTLAEGYRPWPGSVLRAATAVNVLMAVAGLVDWLTGSNYLFLAQKPQGPTPFDLLGPWPWYILSVEALGLLTIVVLYSPFAVRDWWLRRRPRARSAPQPAIASR